MEPFENFTGIVAPLDRPNVDTDQIIPKQFLKRVSRTGYGDYLFFDWRYDEDGNPDPDFVLNQPPFDDAQIMLCRENFGCGSSREHAPWALKDFGIRALISPSFADIFYNNCFKNGMLPVELDKAAVDELFETVEDRPGYEIHVDLKEQTLTGSGGWSRDFEVDAFRRKCLLEGLDEIDLTLQHEEEIRAFEESERAPDPLTKASASPA